MTDTDVLALSVVVPNYNHARYLPQSLGAIGPQLRPMDELIVIDDCSTDNSRDVIADFAARFPQIRPVLLEKNIGAAAAINHGLALARHDYVYFGGADDYMLPGFVDAMMDAARRFPRAGIITSDPGYLHPGATAIETVRMPFAGKAQYFDPQALVAISGSLESSITIASHASILRRQALIEAGEFSLDLKWCSDWFANFVIAFREGLAYVPRSIAVMRVSPTTYSGVGMAAWKSRRPVLEVLVGLLHSARYSDVRAAFADSGIMALFDPDMLRLALQSRDARSLVRKRDVWFSLKEMLRRTGLPRLVPGYVKALRRRKERQRVDRMLSGTDS